MSGMSSLVSSFGGGLVGAGKALVCSPFGCGIMGLVVVVVVVRLGLAICKGVRGG